MQRISATTSLSPNRYKTAKEALGALQISNEFIRSRGDSVRIRGHAVQDATYTDNEVRLELSNGSFLRIFISDRDTTWEVVPQIKRIGNVLPSSSWLEDELLIHWTRSNRETTWHRTASLRDLIGCSLNGLVKPDGPLSLCRIGQPDMSFFAIDVVSPPQRVLYWWSDTSGGN
jgi:hypothetical protein